MRSLKFDLLQTTCEAKNSTKTTHEITHEELFPSGVESGPGHHLPKIEVVMQHRRTPFFFANQALRGFFCALCKTFPQASYRTCPRFTQNLHRGLHTLDSVGDKAHLQDLDSPDVPGNRD
jgi:hypothetical protein